MGRAGAGTSSRSRTGAGIAALRLCSSPPSARYSTGLQSQDKQPNIRQQCGRIQFKWRRQISSSWLLKLWRHMSRTTSDLPALIQAVHSAVESLGKGSEVAQPQIETKPAVSIRKSITPDYLVCLEDGKRFKSLRRHLRLHGLTPVQYREKWSLPSDYPMVAPNYSTERSALAKKIGLGQTRRSAR
jgi:predicted transcriptional regulator